jgi:hypothetical protein
VTISCWHEYHVQGVSRPRPSDTPLLVSPDDVCTRVFLWRREEYYILILSRKPIYRLIKQHIISRYTLILIDEQHRKATRATTEALLSVCTGAFTRVYSLPCAQRINSLIKQNQPIPLTDIHQFWRIVPGLENQAYRPLLEPRLPAPPPKVPDQRDGVLVVPKKKKAPGRCSQCGEVGHNVKKCGM